MARIPPFHTVEVPWRMWGVYHDNDECVAGDRIPLAVRLPGTGDFGHCSECESLNTMEQEPTTRFGPKAS